MMMMMIFGLKKLTEKKSTPQISSCTTTNHPSQKLSKLDKPDMQDSAGEVVTSS